MKKSRLVLIIALLFVGVMSLVGGITDIYYLTTSSLMEMHDGVYLDASETLFNGDKKSLEKGESITSVTVTLVNTSNKDFNDKKVRLMYYNDYHSSVSSGNSDFTYPEGYSLYNQIIDVKAKETVQITFSEFRNTWFYDDNLRVAFEYVWQQGVDLNYSAAWWQLDDGNEFESHHDTFFIIGAVAALTSFIACSTISVLLIVQEKKRIK